MPLKIKRTVDLQIVVHQFVKTTKTHYRTINIDVESVPDRQHYPAPVILTIKKKQKHIMVNMKSTQPKKKTLKS